jgi:hypothetical protein
LTIDRISQAEADLKPVVKKTRRRKKEVAKDGA